MFVGKPTRRVRVGQPVRPPVDGPDPTSGNDMSALLDVKSLATTAPACSMCTLTTALGSPPWSFTETAQASDSAVCAVSRVVIGQFQRFPTLMRRREPLRPVISPSFSRAVNAFRTVDRLYPNSSVRAASDGRLGARARGDCSPGTR